MSFQHKIYPVCLTVVLSLALSFCPCVEKAVFSQDVEHDVGQDVGGELPPDSREQLPPGMYPEKGHGEEGTAEGYPEEIKDTGWAAGSEQIPQEPADDISEAGIEVDEERVSLDLKNIDIVELFRVLSVKTGLTIVPGKRVTGRVNIFLNNVTFKDVLDVILISQDLACERKGDILMIMTSQEYKTRYGKEWDEKRQFRSLELKYAAPSAVFKVLSNLKSDIGKVIIDEASGTVILIDIPEKLALMQKMVDDLERPLETEIFDLDYAETDDMEAHLNSAITAGTGEVFVDKRTGKIAVSDLPKKMGKIRRMVREFDEESREVFIEAEIVQVILRDEFQRGIDWQRVFDERWLAGIALDGVFPVAASFTPSPALTTANFTMNIATLESDKYTAVLQMLETFGDTKILSRPRIAVINNEEAKIMVGAREAYVTNTLSQAETTTVTSESVEFIDVGVKLNVIPTINKEGFITMRIKPEVSNVRETITTAVGSRIPIVETSEAETVVKVKDGMMIMIAGLMKEEKRDDITGIPVLSKMPYIGGIFSSRAKISRKTELIIFLRPHIISGESAMAGKEPERRIPPEVLPEEMKRSLILKEIGKIRVDSGERAGERAAGTLTREISPPLASVEKKTEKIMIKEKLKSLKEY
ncbi:MAG: hypothetical protein DRP85_05175 [Candidatus Makaraimicrobium thalassicum]|nr:MAG: hypothetical protein DRP85_05175 [Candidatus Omnitrophota bacterium]